MIVDTSAIIAIARNEQTRPRIEEALAQAPHVAMSTATRVELAVVIARSLPAELRRRAERVLDVAGVTLADFDAEQARIATDAYRLFGRGSGHKAALNFGDCFAYALAIARDEPLLFVGEDFQYTDVRVALR